MNSRHAVFSAHQESRLASSRGVSRSVVRNRPSSGVREPRNVRALTATARAERLVAFASQKLAEMEIHTILNDLGYIQPEVEDGAKAFVFAIYDENQKLQYIGFSKNIQNSLCTLFSRRPDKAFFYKFVTFPEIDQQAMVDTRTAWFEEVGGAPPGNKLAMERNAWQQPVDANAISDRGKLQAAEEKSKALIEMIEKRGCREQFLPDTNLLLEGLVDFLPLESLTPEEMEKQKMELDRIMQSSQKCKVTIDGEESEFTVFFRSKHPTNGGCMCDINVTHDNLETTHRLIIGKNYYEPYKAEPEAVVLLVFQFVLSKKIPRQTEGMLMSSQFPINYFSISEMEQWYDDFKPFFSTVGELGGTEVWRFNRLFDYGGINDDVDSLNMALAKEDS